MKVDIRWVALFVIAWTLALGMAIETGSMVFRTLAPIISVLFIVYLFVATMMAIFKKSPEEKESDNVG